jgi:hypothetical protein
MAKSLRDALADRHVSLSHSACLEIVARQFGFADWNTLSAKLPAEEERRARPQGLDTVPPTAIAVRAPSPVTERVPVIPLPEAETYPEMGGTSQMTGTTAPWSTCSFCGKSRPEVRILIGGCGGWEGFRARRGPERSNVFICDECVTFAAQNFADNVRAAKESQET